MDRLAIATRFASALDRCDFDEAAQYLAPGCRYEINGRELVGPDAIIASYRESAEWASGAFEQVVYESEVEQEGDSFTVLYIDRLIHHGETHEHRSHQRLWLNDAGLVIRIVHEDLPGEREKLDAFLARFDVKR